MIYRILIILVVAFSSGLMSQAISPQSATVEPTAVQSDGTLRRIRVPILMYHYVSDLPPDADEYRTDLSIAPELFRAHMRYLNEQGYHTISLYQLDEALLKGTQLPSQPVILTFDDGYIDHYTNVFPVLRASGFTGTFFIITGRADAHDPAYMNWAQIQEMAEAGMSMESHTKNHVDLRGRDYDFLVYELLGSLESLKAHTGYAARMFSYPAGRYDENTLKVLGQLPLWRAVTTENGVFQTTDNRLEMPRIRVHGGTGVAGLEELLRRE